jgi:hypothetical protein
MGTRKRKLFSERLVAALHSLPDRLLCTPIMYIRASTNRYGGRGSIRTLCAEGEVEEKH